MAGSIGEGNGGVGKTGGSEQLLSVVVITHNESDRIGACLESIVDACETIEPAELVLVDSRSSDGTVDVASEYPFTILQLPSEPATTPGAGRYVGTAATTGDLVLFVDGDMILDGGWLEGACRRVRETRSLAGVDGHLTEPVPDDARPVDALRGVVLYDRTALDDVGGFDPSLHALEDVDLSYRLDAAGYDLLRLPTLVASHPSRETIDRRRRWEQGYYRGRGQLFRKYVTRPRLFGRLAYRTRLYLGPAAWGSLAPLALWAAGRRGFLAWAMASVAGLAGTAKKRGTDWTADKAIGCGPVLAGILLGLPGEHPSPDEYPLQDVETIQTAPTPGSTEPVNVS